VNGVKFGETSARNGGGNPELSPGSFLIAVSWSKCVAIWAKKTKVCQPVVFVVPIDVVKFHKEWLGRAIVCSGTLNTDAEKYPPATVCF
jgi:hypothetical protein